MRTAGGGGRTAPHARPIGVDLGEGAAQRPESCGGEVRRDLSIRGTGKAENEVPSIPS